MKEWENKIKEIEIVLESKEMFYPASYRLYDFILQNQLEILKYINHIEDKFEKIRQTDGYKRYVGEI